MENHPIPQDITGFQFRLIGNMTVKQFLYLAAGTIIAWLFFFVLPLPAFIRWPIAILAIGLGGGIAFIPIDGRPMDQMFMHLIKAISAPTQYIYDKTGGIITPLPVQGNTPVVSVPQVQLKTQITDEQLQQQGIANPTANVDMQLGPQQAVPSQPISIPTVQQVSVQPAATPVVPPNQPTPTSLGWQIDDDDSSSKKENKKYLEENNELIKNEIKLEGEVSSLKKELEEKEAEKRLSIGSDDRSATQQKTEDLNKILEQTLAQKAELEKELALLRSQATAQAQPQLQAPAPSVAAPAPQTQNVRQVPKGLEKTTGVLAASADPNVIIGIVKDPRGNPLQNILVEVKDPEDNPVRAFKTNALGKFASATPLSNGKYIITFEDTRGQNRFDPVQIEATGNILMPLEVFSVDQREELRRELFN